MTWSNAAARCDTADLRRWTSELGTRLRCARQARQLSRDEVARRVGVIAVTIGSYESGQTANLLHRLVGFSQVPEASLDELLPAATFPLEAFRAGPGVGQAYQDDESACVGDSRLALVAG